MTETHPHREENRAARLIAIARGLEDDGHYNAAKGFRAAAISDLNAATRSHLRLGSGLESEMLAAINELGAEGREPELAAMLARAVEHVVSGTLSTLEDIPETRVCRTCGQVLFGAAKSNCPRCGARPYTFQEIPPAYYLDPVEPDELLAGLQANLEDVQGITAGVSEEDASHGVWPMRDIVNHLLGGERMLTSRAIRMLREDEPVLTLLAPTDIDEEIDLTTQEMVDQFAEHRTATISLFRDITPEQWHRAGFHPEWGRYTVQQQMSYVLRHEQTHLAELELRRNGG